MYLALITNWLAVQSLRDKVLALSMRTALRRIADAVVETGPENELPGMGKRRPGAQILRHSAARHWLMAGKVPLNVVSGWLGQANVEVTLRICLPIVGSDYTTDEIP